MFFVNWTIRQNDCDASSPISHLGLTPSYLGRSASDLKTLKPVADAGNLWSRCRLTGRTAMVHIRFSVLWNRYVATTLSDNVTCNNLLSQPIRSAAPGLPLCSI